MKDVFLIGFRLAKCSRETEDHEIHLFLIKRLLQDTQHQYAEECFNPADRKLFKGD